MIRVLIAQLAGSLLILGLATWFLIVTPPVGTARAGERLCGTASWYSTESGSRTATGAYFDGRSMTAAMPSRSHLGERYRVHYGHSSVDVTINDVGPAKHLHRIIDLSKAAAARIGLIARGVGTVCLERLP